MRALLSLAALALFAALIALPSQAASFDCSKAEKPDELAICGNPELSALDSQMAGLWYAYAKVPMLMGGSGARHDEAEAFLDARATCGGNVQCLEKAYDERIKTIESEIDAAMQSYFELMNADPPTLANDVAPIVSDYADECKALGGTLAADAGTPRMMTADLDGDDTQDYVLNTQNLQCDAAATAFCGNGGCQIDIALSTSGFANPVSALGGQPTLVQAEMGTTLEVWVDGTNCNLPGGSDQECWATYEWSDGALTPGYAARSPAQ
ncbi:lysozyme inhibitor LprI family protein [Devosia nitrariae]|uniref:YARHG domain-containing protein n=1 Tax=Devosia nitrariae TaxID=2071872 RepID=A0ABQ5WCT8_9HYPH|nr:hypothetical protein [Devosia nitrariae]GLQ57325.1 hypothetical protein GCM10010862_45840 [Devosia nitrariae]